MPNPDSDADQLRFAQIRGRMLEGLVEHLPDYFLKQAGVEKRTQLMAKLCESDSVLSIVDICAFVAQKIEEERRR